MMPKVKKDIVFCDNGPMKPMKAGILVLALSAWTIGCATQQPRPRNWGNSPSTTAGVSQPGNSIVSIAKQYLGTPYRYGGTTPAGFDCSGFTGYVYKRAGIKLPRDARDQFRRLTEQKVPKPGDLVFFKINGSSISHVGIYVGNLKFIHSPRTGRSVEIADMRISYWKTRYAGARTAPETALR